MSSGTDLLSIGTSGLFSAKKSLHTSGHNIANVNTEGFSRQKAHQAPNPPLGSGNLVFGTGSYVDSIKRVHSNFIEERLMTNITDHNYNLERNESLSIIEELFNEINYEGLNHSIGNFFNSFRELSNNPESETTRSIVRENAKILIRELKRSREDIVKTNNSLNNKLDEACTDINALLQSVANLNVKINELEVIHGETGDLQDQRNLHLRNLAEFFEISPYIDESGKFIVNCENVGTLVTGNLFQPLSASATPDGDKTLPMSKEVFLNKKLFTDQFKSGKIGAIIYTRKNELKNVLNKIDEVAWTISHAVNAIHRKGFSNKEIPLDAKDLSQYHNIDFFTAPKEINRAAENIDLSDFIKNDLQNICSSYHPNSPGDNRIALALASLQYENISMDGTKTVEDEYLEAVSSLGLSNNKAKIDVEQSQGVLAQTQSIKERISGVSIDEETAQMIKYQHAFDASARVMKVAEEMFKSILEIKR